MRENIIEERSYWSSTVSNPICYPELSADLDVDVVVIGAGIVGLTVAEKLCREGKSVAVLESLRTHVLQKVLHGPAAAPLKKLKRMTEL